MPLVLAGCQSDTRKDDRSEPAEQVTYDQGKGLATRIKADVFLECSALDMDSVPAVFDRAMRLTLSSQQLCVGQLQHILDVYYSD